MIAVIPLWARFGTFSTHPARCATAVAIVRRAFASVLARAMLTAVHPIHPFRTWRLTVLTVPARKALTRTCHVMTFSTVFALAVVNTVQSISTRWTRMLASQAQVSRSADVLAGDVIARHVFLHIFWTLFLTSHTVPPFFTGFGAVKTFPASSANASACFRIARAIIHTFAMRMAVFTVKTIRTFRLTTDPSPFRLTVAMTGDRIAAYAIIFLAIARLATSETEISFLASIFAKFAGEPRRTRACAVLRIAGCIVQAFAVSLAVDAEFVVVAGTIARDASPSCGTVALAVLG